MGRAISDKGSVSNFRNVLSDLAANTLVRWAFGLAIVAAVPVYFLSLAAAQIGG